MHWSELKALGTLCSQRTLTTVLGPCPAPCGSVEVEARGCRVLAQGHTEGTWGQVDDGHWALAPGVSLRPARVSAAAETQPTSCCLPKFVWLCLPAGATPPPRHLWGRGRGMPNEGPRGHAAERRLHRWPTIARFY